MTTADTLYLISICSAAFVLKWNVAIFSASAAALLFCSVGALYKSDIIPDSYRAQASPAAIAKRDAAFPVEDALDRSQHTCLDGD